MRNKLPIKIILEIPFPINDYGDNNVFYLDSENYPKHQNTQGGN